MSLTNSKLSVETIIPEGNITYYVTLQAANTGKSAVDYVSPLLTYNTGLGSFFVNNRVVPTSNVSSLGSIVTSPTPPPNPAVGDLWYDSSSDIQFEYVNDGVNRQWVDITGPTMSIGGPVSTNNFTYLPFTATANPTTTRSFQSGDSVGFSTFTSVSGGYTAYPYTYYIASGTLPTGLTLNSSTGVVSGTVILPYAAANVVFGVRDATNFAITTTVNFTVTAAVIQYLVVAGGGGGASGDKAGYGAGGGGGAGAMFTGSFISSPGPYSITVGGGGNGSSPTTSPGGPTSGSSGSSGNPSTLTGTGVVVNMPGGGGGGFSTTCAPGVGGAGLTGGSGGGGGGATRPPGGTAGIGGVATGSPGVGVAGLYGFPGGAGSASPQPGPTNAHGGGGGGGAGSVGTTAVTPTSQAGPGGAGLTWTYTGPAVFYAGGGGGASSLAPQALGGLGGSSIGGRGGQQSTGSAPGTPGTGSGGGGGWATNAGAPGGPGVVILAIPLAAAPGVTAPGATQSTPPAAPGFRVYTYTTASPTPASFTFTIS